MTASIPSKAGNTKLVIAFLGATSVLAGCADNRPPEIAYDNMPLPAALSPEKPAPVRIVETAKPLPLPGQLKPIKAIRKEPDTSKPTDRIEKANSTARMEPVKDGFINSMQVYPYTAGALYQVYSAVGQVTDIALQPGEELVGNGPVAAGDTVRWIIGDTESGAGDNRQIHILVKPVRADLTTNLVINTNRRTYHLELRSTDETYMASVMWQYPQDQIIALRQQNARARNAEPVAGNVDVSKLNFRYAIKGDRAPWRPVRAYDDGRQVFIEFPRGIAQGEMPPLFVVAPDGKDSELVNYRVRDNYMVVDTLFAAAELKLGDGRNAKQKSVRIERSDGQRKSLWSRK
ncbi:P-type conjugative transfer protein TrbG [uncultured Bartonella sp.]|uniref:P-type conjugative transfer protein TrbG n=1 Tax=uncultured Bartonella sp. TaxID=104108 RepID=UPI00261D72FC|nr:P-type conjugative transfer protein TrbG [uncultured Bartonella sp.]